MNFHGLGGPSWGNFLMLLGCLFQDRFLIVLGSVLGSIWGPFWHYNRTQIEEKTGLILGSIFGASLVANDPLFRGRGGPGGPLICARFQQEKMKRLEFNKKRRPKQEKGSTVLIIVQIIAEFCFHKLMIHDLTRPGQGPANFSKTRFSGPGERGIWGFQV